MPTTLNDPNAENIMKVPPSRVLANHRFVRQVQRELTFTCVEMRDAEHAARYKCSPEGLLSQVLREAHEAGVVVNGENALARFDDEALAQILRFAPRRRGSASHFGERQQLFARISQLDVER